MSRPSPLQNRCAPDGTLVANPARGTMMRNRGGRLHDSDRHLRWARWRSKAWICCRLNFRDRHREVMGSSYTELFFLDEATALAAGHRPCFECRRTDALAFAAAWAAAHQLASPPRAGEMDLILHRERLADQVPQSTADLPDGSMFRLEGSFWLRWENNMHRWSFQGYGEALPLPADGQTVIPITPPTIQSVFQNGYLPSIHGSVRGRNP